MEIIPAPGHTPDSICCRIGGLLFIGDLLAASRPLVAGLPGWDIGGLADTLDRIIRLLETDPGVQVCCPGHGEPMPALRALEVLRRQRERVARAEEVPEVTPGRLSEAVAMALEVIDEGEEAFSAMAGRLLYMAERLEDLGEPEMAGRCRGAMDMAAADEWIGVFRGLCRGLSAGEILPVVFANEAVGIVEKLRKTFRAAELEALLPGSLVNRAERLLMDFMSIARLGRNPEDRVAVDAGALLAEVERNWTAGPHGEELGEGVLGDGERFAVDLARRIGHPPAGARPDLRIEAGAEPRLRMAAAARFGDTMEAFLEWLGRRGAAVIRLRVLEDGGMEIRPEGGEAGDSDYVRQKVLSFARRFAWAGYRLVREAEAWRLQVLEEGAGGQCSICNKECMSKLED